MGTFLNAVKNLINSLTAKTSSTASTADMVQLHDANGNPNGKISLADLASVLGVMFFGAASPTIPENDDLDNYIAAGAYHVAAANIAKNIGNVPYASAGGSLFVITAYSGSNYIIQIYICIRGIYGRKKQSNSWSEWINICTFT